MKKNEINWIIVGAFTLIIVVIAGFFVWEKTQPVDKEQLSSQVNSLSSLISEATLILENSHQQPMIYTKAHLEDIHDNVKVLHSTLLAQKYDPKIVEKKEEITSLSSKTESVVEKLAESWDPQKDPKDDIQELNDLYSLSNTVTKEL